MFLRKLKNDRDAGSLSLTAFLDNIPDCALILDAEARLAYVNDYLDKAWPLGRCLIGQCVWEALPDVALTVAYKQCTEALADGEPRRFPYFSRSAQAWFYVNATPVAGFLVCVIVPDRSGGEPERRTP